MSVKRDKFDFEIGYLVKSPCKECINRDKLPKCSNECSLLNRIQVILSRGVSCSGKFPSANI